jgi:hypothetical protein
LSRQRSRAAEERSERRVFHKAGALYMFEGDDAFAWGSSPLARLKQLEGKKREVEGRFCRKCFEMRGGVEPRGEKCSQCTRRNMLPFSTLPKSIQGGRT